MTFYLHPYPYRQATRRWTAGQISNERTLRVNVREEENGYILSALVLGLSAEDLDIQVLEDVVRIDGQYTADENGFLMQELPHGAFSRTLRLPTAIDAEAVTAKIADGVLTLTLPKAESARPKKININTK